MDPNLFHLDYDRLIEVLIALVIISLFVERALSVLFETEFFNRLIEKNININRIRFPFSYTRPARYIKLMDVIGLKSWVAFGLSLAVCWYWNLDALTIILASHAETKFGGELFTAGIVAGGSKVSSALFHDFLGIMSTAEKKKRRR